MSQSNAAADVAGGQQGEAFAGLRQPAEQRHPIEFTGSAGAYFRIWIVNLALSVVTLGIYSAWAKVRKRRYFYGCTRIDGEGFEYRANPIAILKGRLIALLLFGVYYGAGQVSPLAQLALWIPLLAFAPWLIVRSLAFNAYNSAYRNIRLRFDGTYKALLKIFAGYGLLMLVTAGIAYPWFRRRLTRFVAGHHAFGATRFALDDAFGKPYLRSYLAAWGLAAVLALTLAVLVMILIFTVVGHAGSKAQAQGQGMLLGFGAVLLFYAGLFLILAYVRARTDNAVWNNLSVGPLRFESRLRARDLVWLYFSNLVAVLLTLGLLAPWATVRLMRYRASKTTAIASAPLDGYVQAEAQQIAATGEEVGEMFDVDIAL